MTWRDDLPPIDADRIRDAVTDEGVRRVRRRQVLLGSVLSVTILLLAGVAALAMRPDGGDRTSIATASVPSVTLPEGLVDDGPPVPADATGSSGISGTVTVHGRPLAGATVEVSNESSCCLHRYAYAGADGRYAVTGLPAGTYRVGFTKGARSSWYDDKPTASDASRVTLAEGEQRTGIDGTLIAGASIAGRVTSESGTPIAGMWVYYDGGPWYGKVETGADGTYSISDMPPGDYEIKFDPGPPKLPYIGEFYNNKPESAKADRVHVDDGQQRTGIDAALASA